MLFNSFAYIRIIIVTIMGKPEKSNEQELKEVRDRVQDPKVKDAISKKLAYINKPINK